LIRGWPNPNWLGEGLPGPLRNQNSILPSGNVFLSGNRAGRSGTPLPEAHWLVSPPDGAKIEMWSRATNGFRKVDGKWLVTHGHSSEPFDTASGKALVDLKP
jgi:hypothetical protein